MNVHRVEHWIGPDGYRVFCLPCQRVILIDRSDFHEPTWIMDEDLD